MFLPQCLEIGYWLLRSFASILWVFVKVLTKLFSWVMKMSEKLLSAPRKTIHFCNFTQKALCEYMFLLYFGTKENIKFFKIQQYAWVTYEHMKLAQVKTYLTITPSKETKKDYNLDLFTCD